MLSVPSKPLLNGGVYFERAVGCAPCMRVTDILCHPHTALHVTRARGIQDVVYYNFGKDDLEPVHISSIRLSAHAFCST